MEGRKEVWYSVGSCVHGLGDWVGDSVGCTIGDQVGDDVSINEGQELGSGVGASVSEADVAKVGSPKHGSPAPNPHFGTAVVGSRLGDGVGPRVGDDVGGSNGEGDGSIVVGEGVANVAVGN